MALQPRWQVPVAFEVDVAHVQRVMCHAQAQCKGMTHGVTLIERGLLCLLLAHPYDGCRPLRCRPEGRSAACAYRCGCAGVPTLWALRRLHAAELGIQRAAEAKGTAGALNKNCLAVCRAHMLCHITAPCAGRACMLPYLRPAQSCITSRCQAGLFWQPRVSSASGVEGQVVALSCWP